MQHGCFFLSIDKRQKAAILSHMRQNNDWMHVLQQCPLWGGIPESQIDALLQTAPPPEAFSRGEILYGPAADRHALAIVLQGSALVYKTGQPGKRLLMSRLSPGSTFGMATLFYDGAAFPTEIHAEQACTVLFLSKEWLERAFAQAPQLSVNYIRLLSERIHFLNRRIDALSGDDLSARLLRVLQSFAPDGQEAGTFALPYSLSQLAETLGIGRASLYRALDALEAGGFIARDGKQFTFLKNEPQ